MYKVFLADDEIWMTEKYTDTKVVNLSGFAEVEYAQHTLKQGTVDYLVKPIEQENRIETLYLLNDIMSVSVI